MNLLIDMGNSRLKWAVSHKQNLIPAPAIANGTLSRELLKKDWHRLAKPKRIAIATVGGGAELAMVLTVIEELWEDTEVRHVKALAFGYGVTNAYLQPDKLGVDRWLALIAAHHQYPSDVCIVDCGTAITVDLLDISGRHQGGLICPGLTLMKKALSKGTGALPFSDSDYPLQAANYTEAAIYSGTLSAAIGLIEHVMASQTDTVKLILTGGDAETIAGHMLAKPIIDANLVLQGLAIVIGEEL